MWEKFDLVTLRESGTVLIFKVTGSNFQARGYATLCIALDGFCPLFQQL
jgi:hypothetical protein